MFEFSDFYFPSSNGKTEIHIRRCLPHGSIKASLQISHGVAEHSGRYDDFAAFLAERGIAVYTNDHMGHGRSVSESWPFGYFGEDKGWEYALEDMNTLHKYVKNSHPAVPCFLLGHSMGSFLARNYAIIHPDEFDGLILSGTGQQPKAFAKGGELMSRLEIKKHGAAYQSPLLNNLAFGSYNESFAPVKSSHDWLSRDEKQVARYIDDPLCGFIPSAGLFCQLMRGISFITSSSNLKLMNKDLPVYFMSGDADPVGEMGKGVKRAFASFVKAGMKDVSIRLYSGGRHEMLNETNRNEVYSDIFACLEDWIKQ